MHICIYIYIKFGQSIKYENIIQNIQSLALAGGENIKKFAELGNEILPLSNMPTGKNLAVQVKGDCFFIYKYNIILLHYFQ